MVERIQRIAAAYTPEQRAELARRGAVGLLGLILGLFIGWVLWPVQWSDATLNDLSPDLRAHYLSAVADAYAASGGQNPEVALARLAELDEPETALADAIAYYQEGTRSGDSIRQVNLRMLASVLAADEPPAPSNQATESRSAQIEEPAIGWVNWGLVVLTALLLLAGGIWIGIQIVRHRTVEREFAEEYEENAFEDEPHFGAVRSMSTADQLAAWQTPPEEKDASAAGERSAVAAVPWDEGSVELQPPQDARAARPSVVLETDVEDVWEEEDHVAEAVEIDEATEIDDAAEIDDATVTQILPQRPAPAQEEEQAAESSPELPPHNAKDEEPVPTEAPPPSAAAALPEAAAAPEGKQDRISVVRSPEARQTIDQEEAGLFGTFQGMFNSIRGKEANAQQGVIATFTAHYHHGISDYDESFIITTPNNENELLGACGMGINKDLDPKAANSDEVRVLDVWFYSRNDMRSYNQILVSRSADVDALAGKAQSSGTVTGEPLVAEPGLTFKLQSKDLFLNCRVEQVTYLNGGDDHVPFHSITVAMTVQPKRR